MFDFLKPRYLKEGKALLKGVKKFLDYKQDILAESKIAEVREARDAFAEALKARDKERCEALGKQLTQRCETALPVAQYPGFRENVEVIFVAITVALGIRSYFLQPFKIPTGSMQPTLNGIVSTPQWQPDGSGNLPEQPGFLTKVAHFVWFGRNYVELTAPRDGVIVQAQEKTFLRFFTFTHFRYQDGSTFKTYSPFAKLFGDRTSNGGLEAGTGLGLEAIAVAERTRDPKAWLLYRSIAGVGNRLVKEPLRVKKGDVLARGYVDTGDQVLVNKVAYHFRKPARGEVFVFTTKDIPRAQQQMPSEYGSQHYIKRLVGTPGDVLTVEGTELLIDGKRATEPGMVRVMDGVNQPENAYRGYGDPRLNSRLGGAVVGLELGEEDYFAMGDNSFSSSDSRFFGPVPQKNVVGPGMFVYFPFGHHFGRID